MEIRGYNVIREIGRGGMSSVYLAIQESLDRPVALKVIALNLASEPDFKRRFLAEGRIVAKLTHPCIVTIYDIGLSDEQCFISMEYIEGGDLAHRMSQPIDVADCVRIIRQVASALGHAHRQGFVHRDIKPSNILFRDDQHAVLADFGIAKSLGDEQGLTRTGLVPGTPNYMSPEQISGAALDGRSDLYSLGVVFYEMLTGQRMFEGQTALATMLMHLQKPPPELPSHLAAFRPVLSRLLAKDPAQRFPTAEAFVEALEEVKLDPARPAGVAALRRRALPLLVGLGAAAVGSIGGVLVFSTDPAAMPEAPVSSVMPAARQPAVTELALTLPLSPAPRNSQARASASGAPESDEPPAPSNDSAVTAASEQAQAAGPVTASEPDSASASTGSQQREPERHLAGAEPAAERSADREPAGAVAPGRDIARRPGAGAEPGSAQTAALPAPEIRSARQSRDEAVAGTRSPASEPDPNQALVDELLTRYESLARAKQREGDLQEGLNIVEKGLEVQPAHAALLALRDDLTSQIAADREDARKKMPRRPFGRF